MATCKAQASKAPKASKAPRGAHLTARLATRHDSLSATIEGADGNALTLTRNSFGERVSAKGPALDKHNSKLALLAFVAFVRRNEKEFTYGEIMEALCDEAQAFTTHRAFVDKMAKGF